MNRRLYILTGLLLLCVFSSIDVFPQGCVAVRNMSSCSLSDSTFKGGFQVTINHRYFRSFRHFVGTHEEEERVEQNTEVINNDNSWVIGVAYGLSRRWNLQVAVPFVYIDRSSLYEHKGNASGERYHTQSSGLGDVRVTATYNVLPHSHKSFLNAGIGIKLPTGNYNYKDYFHKNEGLRLLPVDQSIQPGDGGTGLITDLNYEFRFSPVVSTYGTAYYMFNPRNTNGTLRGPNLVDNIPLSNEMSVADQFLFRLGALFSWKSLQFGAGGRLEGIPARDVIGRSDGFRRPGYIGSAEGSVTWVSGRHTFSAQVPVALVRNRTRSVIDMSRPGLNPRTQQPYHGDAAFADWLLSLTYSVRLAGR